jgi:glycosyltransferase involved in cell wall biosynthesis/CMP-N-acetylneuraminic acid synthetase
MYPKITVYIPSHNYGKFLSEAIESVLRQSINDWELLVINDNSTDNTAEIMNRYSGDERIRLFHTNGIGLHGVCNLALQEGKGKYIIRLDGDDIFDENILLVLSNYLDTHKDTVLVFPDYYLIDEFGDIFAHERRQKLYQNNHAFDMPPNGACFLANRQVLIDLGGYREDLKAQDGYYIWTKIIDKHKSANINLPLYYYRRHGTSLTTKSEHILAARRKIKKETMLLHLDDFRPFSAIIPCRRNYDFCQDFWKRSMNTQLMIERMLTICTKSKILDNIIVACDNPEIEEALKKSNDTRVKFFQRSPRETIRSESIAPTLEQVVAKYDKDLRGTSVISYVQAPFITTDTLEEAIFTLIMNNADSSIGVEEIDKRLYQRTAYGMRPINPPTGISSDFQTVYQEARTILATRNYNLSTGSLSGAKIVNFVISRDETFIIDSEKSFQIATIIDAQKRVLGI